MNPSVARLAHLAKHLTGQHEQSRHGARTFTGYSSEYALRGGAAREDLHLLKDLWDWSNAHHGRAVPAVRQRKLGELVTGDVFGWNGHPAVLLEAEADPYGSVRFEAVLLDHTGHPFITHETRRGHLLLPLYRQQSERDRPHPTKE